MIKLNADEEKLSASNLVIYYCWANELDEKFIRQLIKKSRQAHILQFEREEDTEGRFKDLDSYKIWAKKNRLVYLLVDEAALPDENLAGIIWFGKRRNEQINSKYCLTFGIRLYEGYVGKGLSKPLMRPTHEDAREKFKDCRYIWLDFDKENIAANRAYESFGYKTIKTAGQRTIMAKKL